MATLIVILFVLGYLAIAFEHPLKLDKSVSALFMAALIWALLSIGFQSGSFDVINAFGETFNFSSGGENAVDGLEALVYGTINGEEVGTLRYTAEMLEIAIPNQDIVVLLLGVLSAIVDNVPLVAATMGMYDFATDHEIWHFIAYSAGTGGSMLIIGSAAGVAAMGMERIDFIWYLKKIGWLAFIGFITGAGVFLLIEKVLFPNVV